MGGRNQNCDKKLMEEAATGNQEIPVNLFEGGGRNKEGGEGVKKGKVK